MQRAADMAGRGSYCKTSCFNCRLKKRKCDGQEVCAYCAKHQLRCERTQKDNRSVRLSTSETTDLREEAVFLKGVVAQISDLADNDNATEHSTVYKIRAVLRRCADAGPAPCVSKRIPVSVGASGGGEYSVFGPTSAFHTLVDMTGGLRADSREADVHQSPAIQACVGHFFKWLYPDITVFIHRESFLNEFLQRLASTKYCSQELVHAIAALGAKCSDSAEERDLAPTFYENARAAIFANKVCEPQINTLQALLCLSLYELGDGNALASWMLSGMALRMGYDLGFQLNPQDWTMETPHSVMAKTDIMVRSRIYWGCYIVDHFVSLIMGRPVTVRKTEATVPSSKMLPNAENIDAYVFSDAGGDNIDAALTIEPLCAIGDCVGALLADIFSAYTADDSIAGLTRAKVVQYNTRLADWRRKLPSALRWTRSSLAGMRYNPTLMNFRLMYYVVVICLNRPFLTASAAEFPGQLPRQIFDDALAELAQLLDTFNASGYPPSILVVYSSILALSVLLLQLQALAEAALVEPGVSGASLAPMEPNTEQLSHLSVFCRTVSAAALRWKLAARSALFFRNKVAAMPYASVQRILEAQQEPLNLTQMDFDQVLEMDEDMFLWGNQDNLLTNILEFWEHDGARCGPDVTRRFPS